VSSLNDAAPRVSLGEVVAERISEAILRAELKPGQRLREEQFSEQLKVSRGPVRDAFLILEREGLVRLSPHRGARVVDLTPADFGEVYSLRLSIEDLAIRLAVQRRVASDLDALERAMSDMRAGIKRRMTEHEAARLDVEFHDRIFVSAHHQRLQQTWASIRMQVFWFLQRRNVASADWRSLFLEGHQKLVDAVRDQDDQAAVGEIHTHIQAAYQRIIDSILDAEPKASTNDHAGSTGAEIARSYLLA